MLPQSTQETVEHILYLENPKRSGEAGVLETCVSIRPDLGDFSLIVPKTLLGFISKQTLY